MESLEVFVDRLRSGNPPPDNAGLFGGDPNPEECEVVIIPVPWDGTASYGKGTAKAIQPLVAASHYLDFEDGAFDTPYSAGVCLLSAKELENLCSLEAGSSEEANPISEKINLEVETLANKWIEKGKLCAVLGGEHSAPLGLIRALGKTTNEFGILHVDAHMDLRNAYEGYRYSHASIMFNALNEVQSLSKIVQLGIRDYSAEERLFAVESGKVDVYYDRAIQRGIAAGLSKREIYSEAISRLPRDIYISFDIDGLDPALCPATGTPVPGGLSYEDAMLILELAASDNHRIIGFDLCEVGYDGADWDVNVGARVLYKLFGAAVRSRGKCGESSHQKLPGFEI